MARCFIFHIKCGKLSAIFYFHRNTDATSVLILLLFFAVKVINTQDDAMNNSEQLNTWSANKSADLYGIDEWSSGYFGVSPQGDVVVRAQTSDGDANVSLMAIVDGLQQRGLQMPVLLRLENIVDSRISILNDSFAQPALGNATNMVWKRVVKQS
jgi:hypothetical protein